MRGHDACRMPLRQWCGAPFPAALQLWKFMSFNRLFCLHIDFCWRSHTAIFADKTPPDENNADIGVQRVRHTSTAVYGALLSTCASFWCALWSESMPFACRKLPFRVVLCTLLGIKKHCVISAVQFVFTAVLVVLSCWGCRSALPLMAFGADISPEWSVKLYFLCLRFARHAAPPVCKVSFCSHGSLCPLYPVMPSWQVCLPFRRTDKYMFRLYKNQSATCLSRYLYLILH